MDADHGKGLNPPMKQPPDNIDIELRMLVEAVYLKYNYDFRDYTGAFAKRQCSRGSRSCT